MEVVAKLKYARVAPRKLRLIADLIRGKTVALAQSELPFSRKRGAKIFAKLLQSAVANAKNNFQLDEKNLYLAKVLVDEGPKLKRWRARSRGRAFPIQKKTAHLTIILGEIEKSAAFQRKKKEEKKMVTRTRMATEASKRRTEKPLAAIRKSRSKAKPARGFQKFFRRKAF